MAVNAKTENTNILSETALTSVTINRNIVSMPNPQDAPTPSYGINLSYADAQYIVDEKGEKVRLIGQGMNQRWVNYNPEKVATFYSKALTVDGKETTLGELLAELLDAEILVDLSKPVVAPPAPMVP